MQNLRPSYRKPVTNTHCVPRPFVVGRKARARMGGRIENLAGAADSGAAWGQPADSSSNTAEFPFEYLIFQVIQKQNAAVRDESLRLCGLAASAADKDAGSRTAIPRLVDALASDLAADLAETESRFPLLLNLELAYVGDGPVPTYSQPIGQMLGTVSTQHNRQLKRLKRICELAASLSRSGNQAARDLAEGLKALYWTLLSHSRIEDEMLTRAARMEAEIFPAHIN